MRSIAVCLPPLAALDVLPDDDDLDDDDLDDGGDEFEDEDEDDDEENGEDEDEPETWQVKTGGAAQTVRTFP